MRNRKILWRVLLIAATALWMAFIFGRSLRAGGASSEESGSVTGLLQKLVDALGWQFRIDEHVIRKIAHATEFFILGALACGTFYTFPLRAREAFAAGGCLLVASIDETIQYFVPGRGARITDVLIDLGGGLLAVFLVGLIFRNLRKRKKSTEKF